MTKKDEEVKLKKNYHAIDPTKESAFGYWIIPLIALIIIGSIYVYLSVADNLLKKPAAVKREADNLIENPFQNSEMFKNRSRSGAPLDFNEAAWGKENPFN